MKKIHLLVIGLLLAFTVLFITSCSHGLRISHDYDRSADFSTYKTFSVYGLVTTPNVSAFNVERIAKAIRNEMTRKGYTEDDRHPDLAVSAVTILEKKQTVTATINGARFAPYRSMDFDAVEYKEGTLVVGIIDVRAQRLLWEGSASSELAKKPKDLEKAIGHVVSRILEGYPDRLQQNGKQPSLY